MRVGVACRAAGVAALVAVSTAAMCPSAAAHPQQASAKDFSATEDVAVTAIVAVFEAPESNPALFVATINWGDGSEESEGTVQSQGDLDLDGLTDYTVTGTHTYATSGTFGFSVLIGDVHDQVQVDGTATVGGAGGGGSGPGPEGGSGPGPGSQTAAMSVLPAAPKAGELVAFDASASQGEISGYHFDLDGNGSYETKCASPSAGAVYREPLSRSAGLKVVGPKGSNTTQVNFTVAASSAASTERRNRRTGPRAAQVTAGGPLPAGVEMVGGCGDEIGLNQSVVDAIVKLYVCPLTLRLGYAELVIPPGRPRDICFQFKDRPLGVDAYQAPPGEPVFVNGLALVPENQGVRIQARVGPFLGKLREYIETSATGDAAGGRARVVLAGQGTDLRSKLATLSWDLSHGVFLPPSRTVQTLALEGSGRVLGLPNSSGQAPLTFTRFAEGQLPVRAPVPAPFRKLSQAAAGDIASDTLTLRTTNTAGLVVGTQIAFGDIPLGVFTVKNLKLTHRTEGGSDIWDGTFELSFPGPNVKSVGGSLTIQDGALVRAGVYADTNIGPIGPGIFITYIALDLSETMATGQLHFSAGPKIVGDFSFATLRTTGTLHFVPVNRSFDIDGKGVLTPIKVDNAFFEATGDLDVVFIKNLLNAKTIMGTGKVAFGSRLTYEFPRDLPVLLFGIDVAAQGGVVSGGGFKLSGRGHVYGLKVWELPSLVDTTGNVAVSQRGAAVCANIFKAAGHTLIAGGAYYKWATNDGGIFGGCSWNKIISKSSVAVAAGTRAFRMPRGLRHTLIRFRGRGAPPQVELVDARGRRSTSPGQADPGDRTNFVWGIDPADNATVVVAFRPAPGRWRVSELPGSAAITDVGRADPLPARSARARVAGRRHNRVLHYRVAPVRGQRVTFVEEGPEFEQVLGRVRSGRGSIRFSPTEGRGGLRPIRALIERQGFVMEQPVVARYKAPRPQRPTRPRVTVRRAGSRLRVRWSGGRHARTYRVVVNLGDGRRHFFLTGRRRLEVAGLVPRVGAAVSVTGVTGGGRGGRAGTGRLRALPALQALSSPAAGALARSGLRVRVTPSADGLAELRLMRGRRVLGHASPTVEYGRTAAVRVRLTPRGRRLVRRRPRGSLRLVAQLPGEAVRRTRIALRPGG